MAGEKIIEQIKKDFGFLEGKVIAVLLYGSVQKGEESSRSDVDICIVAPQKDRKKLLKEIFRSVDVHGKKYDVFIFEELPLYIKAEVIQNNTIVFGDAPELYEYFYFFRKLWDDQKHRQEVTKADIMKILS